MRVVAFALTVPPLVAALLVAALIATAMPGGAQTAGRAEAGSDRAVRIEDCMREMRSGMKAGQKMTKGQRLLAEEQCRARVEAAAQQTLR